MNFRRDSIYISPESMFYLNLEAKRIVEGTDASMTHDQLADSLIRKVLTEENPEYVTAWSEFEEAKQKASKEYRAIEEKALGRRAVQTDSDYTAEGARAESAMHGRI